MFFERNNWLLLDLIPLDFVGFHVQLKAAAVAFVHSGVLRFISIVYYAVFAVLYIGMYFHVEVGGEPLVQLFFIVSGPQDCTVQNTAVSKL